MLKIYHNPSCKKSHAGLQFLKESGHPYEVVEYLKNPITEKDLERLIMKLNCKPAHLLRTQEEYFKKQLKGKSFNDHELVRIIQQQPRLLQRPIVESNYKAVIGDPADNIASLFP